jgi:hypothetical protein
MHGLPRADHANEVVHPEAPTFLRRRQLGRLADGQVRVPEPFHDGVLPREDYLVDGGSEGCELLNGEPADRIEVPGMSEGENGRPLVLRRERRGVGQAEEIKSIIHEESLRIPRRTGNKGLRGSGRSPAS